MNNPYLDIMDLPHRQSARRPHMPIADRAAQFSPFSALIGYPEHVKEMERLTDEKIILSESALEELNHTLNELQGKIHENPRITITCFHPDDAKTGGSYVKHTGYLRKIDLYQRTLFLKNGEKLLLDDIVQIDRE